MLDIAGLVVLATVGLWIAYLVPHRLRYRQQLLESRTEDRFSDALRVLVVAEGRSRDRRGVEARVECGPDSAKRSGLLSPARGVPVTRRTAVGKSAGTSAGTAGRPDGRGAGGPAVTERRGGVVERPYGTQDKMTADAARRQAKQRAQRAAAVARRAAAARRRAVLTAGLLTIAAAAWVVVGVTSLAVVAAVVPTVLLVGVLGLGRRAAMQGQAADAAWEAQQRRAQSAPVRPAGMSTRITGRALHPSDSHTEAIAHVESARRSGGVVAAPGDERAAELIEAADKAAPGATTVATASGDAGATATEDGEATPAQDAPVRPAEGDQGEGWSPVPVPRPTYTTKATAPRREPLPLVVEDATPAAPADAVADQPADADVSTPPALDLDAILARRRAAGE